MEIEQKSQIYFVDVLLICNLETISTTVYRKVTRYLQIFTLTGNLSLLVTGNGGL